MPSNEVRNIGLPTSRSIAAKIRNQSGVAKRLLASLPLVRIEWVTSNLIPVRHRIAGIAETADGHCEVIEVLKVTPDCVADDLGSAPPDLGCDCIQFIDCRIREPCSDLGHGTSNVTQGRLTSYES